MSTPLNGRRKELVALIAGFLSERLNAKLEKLGDADSRRAELKAQYEPAAWLESAARRVSQIQAVTHSLKPLHPDAKGSNLFCSPAAMASLAQVGSHLLGNDFEMDVVGNAAALDVYKFLKLEYQGQRLIDLVVAGDADLTAAFNDDPQIGTRWAAAFAGLVAPRGGAASHALAKQLYWLVDDDANEDGSYHLLAPLYPTSLIQRVYQRVQDDRFGEETLAAREAFKNRAWHPRPLREYRSLVIQKLGGTKPQNVSQLNSERRGENLLLASLPPKWKTADVRPLLRTPTLFRRYGWSVRDAVKRFKHFLERDPARQRQTRERRDAMVDDLLERLSMFADAHRTLAPNWSRDPECLLPPAERRWLDPDGEGAAMLIEDAIDDVAHSFANWLNKGLSDPLPLGDEEYRYWRKLARLRLRQAEREVTHDE